uniref:Uncharacterized protein n=1 Tax=Sciurus vulgaris TaxID=55149 RepID=A0A8D2DK97_SCIVU
LDGNDEILFMASNHFSKRTFSEEATETRLFKDPGTEGIRMVSIATICHMTSIFVLALQTGKQAKTTESCSKLRRKLKCVWVPARSSMALEKQKSFSEHFLT